MSQVKSRKIVPRTLELLLQERNDIGMDVWLIENGFKFKLYCINFIIIVNMILLGAHYSLYVYLVDLPNGLHYVLAQ